MSPRASTLRPLPTCQRPIKTVARVATLRVGNSTRAILPLLWGLIFGSGFTSVVHALTGPVVVHPNSDEQIVFTFSKQNAADTAVINSFESTAAEQHIARAKQALLGFQASANPRFLGDAQRELAGVAEVDYGADFYLYRASLRQSLHQFSQASADLDLVAQMQPDNFQAQMMRFTIAFVIGDYSAAELACEKLQGLNNDLYVAACRQHVRAAQRPSEAESAYLDLKSAMASAGALADRQALAWAAGSLADIAERAGRDDAAQLWQWVLSMNANDAYARARLAALKLAAEDYAAVIALTADHLTVDSLAVLNAIAARHQGGGEALISQLRERFSEALWRGEVLHKRAYAQFLLDIDDTPSAALTWAERNWQDQREWPDAQLLARAQRAAGADL